MYIYNFDWYNAIKKQTFELFKHKIKVCKITESYNRLFAINL